MIDGTKQKIKKLNEYLEKNDRKTILFFSIVLCLLSCFCIILGNTQRFALNDDAALNAIAIGNRGERNRTYLPFCNICYGYLLYALYEITDCINWYTIFPMLLSILALVVLTVTLSKISENRLAPLAVFIFILAFGECLFATMTFTYFAAFFSAVGLFLIYLASIKLTGRQKYVILLIGVALGLVGYWIRRGSFISVAPVIAVCVAWQFLRTVKTNADKRLTKAEVRKLAGKFFGCVWGFLLLGCLVWISYRINVNVYNTSEEWTFWQQFNRFRAALLDYPRLDYNLYEAEYNAIGIDELDYDFFFSWSFADLNKFNLDTLKKMNDLRLQVQTESFSLVGSIISFLKGTWNLINAKMVIALFLLFAGGGWLFAEKKPVAFTSYFSRNSRMLLPLGQRKVYIQSHYQRVICCVSAFPADVIRKEFCTWQGQNKKGSVDLSSVCGRNSNHDAFLHRGKNFRRSAGSCHGNYDVRFAEYN